MKRVRGLVKAVFTIAGAISLSSPLVASAAGGVTQGVSMQQKDEYGLAAEGARMKTARATKDSSIRSSSGSNCERETEGNGDTRGQGGGS